MGIHSLCLLCIVYLLSGCQPPATVSEQQIQQLQFRTDPSQTAVPIEEIQADLESFADEHTARVAQAVDLILRRTQSVQDRAALIGLKIATGTGSLRIAIGPNPVVSTMDMVVHITLVRRAMEKHLSDFVNADCESIIDELRRSEQEIWTISEQLLNETQQQELAKLIDDWCDANPDTFYVFSVRFDDFAALRKTVATSKGKSRDSIFSLLLLDPLASLDPTTAELTEARLLTERIFYYVQRLPMILNWRFEYMFMQLVGTPEMEQLLLDSRRVGESADRLSRTVEDLEGRIPQHTETIVRELNTALTQQREALIADLELQEAVLRPLLDDTRLAIEQAESAADAITTAMVQSEATANDIERAAQAATEAGDAWARMAETVGATIELIDTGDDNAASKPANDGPPPEPVRTQDVLQSIEQARDTATELRKSLEQLNALIADDSLPRRLDDTRRGMTGIINTAMWRGVLLLILAFCLAVIYRLVVVRLIAR
jgi:hypothetical protein